MTTEHYLSSESTMMDLRNVLEHLKEDARDAAIGPAINYAKTGDEKYRTQAAYALGQESLIKSLLWALDGSAHEEGVGNPTVSIYELES